jgi:pimeloyl-ACP methyl ester carboxylesterase
LEGGAGVSSAFWGWVQRRLSSSTPTLSYDRAGYGDSDAAPTRRRIAYVDGSISDLEELLRQASLPGPNVHIGHSSGALWAQAYAAWHPERIRALVLIDPTPESLPGWIKASLGLTATLTRGVALFGDVGLLKLFNPFVRGVEALPDPEKRELSVALAQGRHLRATAAELDALSLLQRAVQGHPLSPKLPVLVLTAGDWRAKATRRRVRGLASFAETLIEEHAAVAGASQAGRHVIVEGANHVTLVADEHWASQVAAEIKDFVAGLGGAD